MVQLDHIYEGSFLKNSFYFLFFIMHWAQNQLHLHTTLFFLH